VDRSRSDTPSARADPDGGAAELSARRVAAVRDHPDRRLRLLRASSAPPPGAGDDLLAYARAATAFMGWQLRRGVLNPLGHAHPGSAWWRSVNERLLRETCEAGLHVQGHGGPRSSPSVELWIAFSRDPSPSRWYLAHNATIVRAYLDHHPLAEQENRVERFFVNLVLVRVMYAHALVAEPRLALGWLAPLARRLGDPRRDATGVFLSVSRVLPDRYPMEGELDAVISAEHVVGRLLDVGVIVPRLAALYEWSADALGIPGLAALQREGVPVYAWDPDDGDPWGPEPARAVRVVRRALPAPAAAPG
jgi:hypothetical protein